MIVSKSKTYTNLISLLELKSHCKIDESDSSYDQELTRLSKVALTFAEKHTQSDIVPTTSTLEDYCFSGSYYDIQEASIIVSGITGETTITGFTVRKYSSFTRVVFASSLSNVETLKIRYNSGFSTLPVDVVHAIKIKVAELLDADRSGYIPNNIKETKAFERLLSNYVNY